MTQEATATNPPIDGGQNRPPANPAPGFTHPPAVPAPAATQDPAPAQPQGLDQAIAALTAALAAQNQNASPAQANAPAAPAGESLSNLDVSTLEDPIIRSMATVMQTIGKGLDMDRVFSKAIDHGDASLLDIAYLKEKGGENSAQLITIAEGIIQAIEAQSSKVTQGVFNLAGGEQNWVNATAVFNKVAPLELRTVVAAMLDSNKESQIQAGAKLVVEYAKGSGALPNVNPLVASGAASVSSAQALSKDEFQAALQKLNPNDKQYQAQRNELFARRQVGKNLGK